MSAEEGSGPPPTAGADKAQPAKPAAAFTSSFINKNTTGKKFAPKAARRRPGAAPAAAAPKPSAPESAPPVAEAQTTQVEPESSNAPSETSTPAQLPTPAATQEPSSQHVPQATPSVLEAATTATTSTSSQHDATPADEPLLTPASTAQPPIADEQFAATPATEQPASIAQDEVETGRAAKRRRMDPPARKSGRITEHVVESATVEAIQPEQSSSEQVSSTQHDTSSSAGLEPDVALTESSGQTVITDTTQATLEEAAAAQPRKRRVLPWASVNRPQQWDEEEVVEEAAPAPPKKTRKPPKPRGQANPTATTEEQIAGEGESVEGSEAQPVRKRPSAKARGKRKADVAVAEDGTEAPAPATRTRRTRKVKSKATVHDTEEEEEEEAGAVAGSLEGQAESEEPAARPKQKPRQPKRKRRTAAEGGKEANQDAAPPKRKGRPLREPTPPEAEDEQIDPESTLMSSIASRNIRVGKLSEREKAMRKIPWEEVIQRRRAEDSRKIDTKAEREAAEKLFLEAAPQHEGPRLTLVDGTLQLLHGTTTLDREGDADREIENYEILEEQDLTTRITSRSFLKNNKRFPNDFILPGQGKRWTAADTELFYQGLQHFGTDFQMISHMFPGSTRRSMKLKFTREEREDPARVRDILLSRSTLNSNWDDFVQVSQMDEEKFVDADEIKRQLAEEEAEFRARIDAAKAETEERKRQQREAGLLDEEDENGDSNNKENGKAKKNRKGKEKQVTFQEEAGVEILGNVDDDATWGQE